MYSKMLLSNPTFGQDNLLFYGLNVKYTDLTGLNIISFLKLKLKDTSNIFAANCAWCHETIIICEHKMIHTLIIKVELSFT